MLLEIILFFVIALVYSSAGFGGGSMYLAALSGANYGQHYVRFTALMCNGLVTASSTLRYLRSGLLLLKPTAQLLAFSIPASIWSSTWQVEDKTYFLLLAVCLLLVAAAMLFQTNTDMPAQTVVKNQWFYFPLSALIGLMAGITGIGGGIYLSPILHLMRWASARQIAATSAAFIFFNSMAALLTRLVTQGIETEWTHLWLGLSVIAGGLLGSYSTIRFLSEKMVRYFTILIIIVAATRIFFKYSFP